MSDIAAVVADNLDIWTGAIERKSGAGRGGGGKRISLFGIERLRALILDLAVRGKLVPQDTSDEPADELLKRFVTQRSDWVAKKRMRMGKPLPKLAAHELRFDEPTGWQWIRFGDLGDWGAGATPNRKKSAYYGGEMPWFKSGELAADFISVSEETVTELALQECSLRLNQPGDVLIAMYGATIGKASILEVEATTNQAVCACTPFHGVDNRFLLLLLKAMKPIFVGQGAGGAQPNISREKIIATPLCLPPLAEQRRIVAKVDELMALCDALEWESANALAAHQTLVETLLATLVNSADAADLAANWARLESNFDTLFTTEASIDALKQTILDLAVRGKLVEQEDRTSDTLAKIAAERKTMAAAKMIRLKNRAKTGKLAEAPFEVPPAWQWAELGELGGLENGDRGREYPNKSALKPSGVPFVNAGHIQNGKIDATQMTFISEDHFERLGGGKFQDGDILYCLRGSLGKSGLVVDIGQGAIASSLVIIRLVPSFLQRFMMIYLGTALAEMMIKQYDNGTAQPNLSSANLERFSVPVPPVAEQHRIVAKVDELMALCDALKARLADAAKTRRHLADAMIERAAA